MRVRTRRITIDMGSSRRKVSAVVFGIWAAHRCPEKHLRRFGWRITHAPSGYGLNWRSDGLSRAEAIRVARLLAERVPALDHRNATPNDEHIVDAVFGEAIGR